MKILITVLLMNTFHVCLPQIYIDNIIWDLNSQNGIYLIIENQNNINSEKLNLKIKPTPSIYALIKNPSFTIIQEGEILCKSLNDCNFSYSNLNINRNEIQILICDTIRLIAKPYSQYTKAFLVYNDETNSFYLAHSAYLPYIKHLLVPLKYSTQIFNEFTPKLPFIWNKDFSNTKNQLDTINLFIGRGFDDRVKIVYNKQIIESNVILESIPFNDKIPIKWKLSNERNENILQLFMLEKGVYFETKINFSYKYMVIDFINDSFEITYLDDIRKW